MCVCVCVRAPIYHSAWRGSQSIPAWNVVVFRIAVALLGKQQQQQQQRQQCSMSSSIASAERSGELGSVPSTLRGHPTAIAVGGAQGGGDGVLVIRCGAGIVLRSLSDPLRGGAEVIYQHAAAAVTAVAVHPKGSWIASGDENGVLKLWPRRKAEGWHFTHTY